MIKLLSEILKPIELDDITHKTSEKKKKDHWGYHLIMDMSHCNKDIDNPDKVSEFLTAMTKALKMKAYGKPLVHRFPAPARGVSGVQIIYTSSITIHSDNVEWCAYIDVFSCKKFKPETAISLTKKFFEPKSIKQLFLYRDAGPWPEQ